MRSADEIFALYQQRKMRLSPMHKAALEVRTAYYGEIVLPLPELDRQEKPLVANLVFSAGEQKAMRVASTMPNMYYPSAKPGTQSYDQRARQRRLVNLAWWDKDKMKLKLRKRARHMVYYASAPVMLRPHMKDMRPTWQTRNPLTTLAPEMDVGDIVPEDVIFTYTKSASWLMSKYPQAIARFGDPKDIQDGVLTILEYQDADSFVLACVGERVERNMSWPYAEPSRVEMIVELERTPNRVGRCTCVLAGGIGLDHARGSFDGTIGMWQAMGKMMALEAIGMQRSIWPEMWLTDDPSSDGANIITTADPLRGIVGHVTGGKIEAIRPEPSQQAANVLDRLERGVRLEAGIPAELGGESTSNIRTGKRGDQILSSVLDFPLQEMQEILAVSLQEEDKIAIEIDKTYFPQAKSIYISATAGEITYEANKLWEDNSDTHWVAYSHAGVDEQGLVIELGQLIGTGMISKRSAMESHPLIEDAEGEFDRIEQERIDDALLNGLAQIAQDPQMAPVVAQVALQLKRSEVGIPEAVIAVHQAIQQMQDQQAQQQQQMQQGMPGASPGAEAQPGMGQPIPSIAAPPQGMGNLAQMLRQLKVGNTASVGPQASAVA